MEKLKTLWHDIRDSLWFVPSLVTIGCGAAAILLIRFNSRILGDIDAREYWWLFGGGSDGAQSVLQVISGSIITVTGVVFSVTMIVLQLASSQFTPRVLRKFMADRANQLVLGVFIGTFTYTLLVLRTVRGDATGEAFVPQVAVTGAVVLALISIGFLIFFINHVARSVQAAHLIDAIAQDTLRVIEDVYPDRIEDPDSQAAADTSHGELFEGGTPVHAVRAGYVQGVDYATLAKLARALNAAVRVEVEIGSFVLPGQHLVTVTHTADGPDQNALLDAVILGDERTPRQDPKYGVLELMDIAVKAMSPSVNDPTTAVNAVHRLSEVLLEMAWRDNGDRVMRDGDAVRVVGRRPSLDDTVGLAFDQIRHYSAENPSVAIVLLRALGELAALSPARSRRPFVAQLEAVERSAAARVPDAADRERVAAEAAHARSRATAPTSTRREVGSGPA
jgi:uncharacterized membrane protein